MKASQSIHFQALVLIAAVASSGAAALASDCKDEARYPVIEREELASLIAKKQVVTVDVNSKESFSKHHVPGAIHYGSHKADFAKQLPADKGALIVAYCGGPKCMAWKDAAEAACELKYTNIRHFKAGISGWEKKGS